MAEFKLPPLPKATVDEHNLQGGRLLYTAAQMREYATQALRAALDQPALAQQPAVPPGYKLLKNSTHAERSWPEDASHENGSYHCTCVNCGREFVGYKRRVVCRVCDAMLNAAPEATAAQKEQP